MSPLVIRDAEVRERPGLDVRIEDGRIAEIGPRLDNRGAPVVEAGGGALVPGLHDHHLHVLAFAAWERSVQCGPPDVRSRAELVAALRRAPGEGWVRAVGWDDTSTGWLDADALDAAVAHRPVRIQHRSGHLWVVNRRAAAELRLDEAPADGVERDVTGRPTGRLYELDGWLRTRLPANQRPDVGKVSERLASWGVTGVTDATVTNDASSRAALADLGQRLTLMGGDDLPEGPRKVMVNERSLPSPDELAHTIRAAHDRGRTVAVHATSREALVLSLTALEEAGTVGGDRVEHATVAPPELIAWMVRLGLQVVTQPGFVSAHGDRHLATVDHDDRRWLHRGRGFLDAEIPLGAGSDAPFGPADPWIGMRAAVERRTDDGRLLNGGEAISPEQALALFTGPAARPGGPPRRIAVGEPADLCLLRLPWASARCELSSDLVAATVIDGRLVWGGPA